VEGQLVSVSYDFSAQVWDLATRAPTHNFQVIYPTCNFENLIPPGRVVDPD
jgi:hypothetical protein